MRNGQQWAAQRVQFEGDEDVQGVRPNGVFIGGYNHNLQVSIHERFATTFGEGLLAR